MEVPESVEIGVKAIRDTYRLVFNPEARITPGSARSFDVNGRARKVAKEGRWELWDTSPEGVFYKVMTLQDEKGGYRPPDQRLVDFLNLINPEKYGGDVEKMVEALIDKPNEYAASVDERDFERLIDSMASYYTPARGQSMVSVSK